jgi:hypothetical protein
MSSDVELIRHEATEADFAKNGLLNVLAEGQPYVFLTLGHGTDEQGQYIVVNVMTDITEKFVLEYVLNEASGQVDNVLVSNSVESE